MDSMDECMDIKPSVGTPSVHSNGSTSGNNSSAQRRRIDPAELCRVCEDSATGYHYGIASCNGCKTFFRRTVVSGHVFSCQYEGKCEISKNARCACRHCRFNKCISMGMDQNAIQNDRDRIGPTKRIKVKCEFDETTEECDGSPQSSTNNVPDLVMENLLILEEYCCELRVKEFPDNKSARETLNSDSLLYDVKHLPDDLYFQNGTLFKDLYPASMNDIQMWNIRELKLCLEWVKTLNEFRALPLDDQFALVHNFAFTFNILNRVYYSRNCGPDKIVYHNGAYILRQPQESVRIPGCRSIYHRQMDEVMLPLRKLEINPSEFAAFKVILLFNPDACDITPQAKADIEIAREKYVSSLFNYMTTRYGVQRGGLRFGNLLLMCSSIQQIIAQNDENMQVMEVFGHFWRIDQFVKELCMKAQH
uniref:Nuclear receptor domain-containing protein n=1 Tax=Rhabditophanes sp. KR3021 TaxID=114890 RepID=A0AC35TRJ4_9BILA